MKKYKIGDIEKNIIEDINKLFDKQDRFIRDYPTNLIDIAEKYNLSRAHIYNILYNKFDKKWLNERFRRLLFQVRMKRNSI